MNTTPTVSQLADQVRGGQPGAGDHFLRHLQPHMQRMLRRALRGGQSPLDVALRRAAEAGGDLAVVAKSLCANSAARLAPDAAAPTATQLGAAAWHAATAVA